MVRLSRRALLGGSIGCLAAGRARAQQKPTFSAQVNVVNVVATVFNEKGQLVEDLTRDDFQISEDGRPQVIQYFSGRSATPLSIALLVDTSNSQQRLLHAEGRTAVDFMQRVRRNSADRSMIVRFDRDIRILQDFATPVTPDAIVRNLTDAHQRGGGGTLFYGALYAVCRDELAGRPGRKVIIVLTDGLDYGSESKAADAVERAVRSDVAVFSVLFFDLRSYPLSEQGRDHAQGVRVLKSISELTGGAYYEPTRTHTMEQIFSELEANLRAQYSIGYVSDKPVVTPQFRTLTLSARRPGLVVQARRGYYAEP